MRHAMRHEIGPPASLRLHPTLYAVLRLSVGLVGLAAMVGRGRAIGWVGSHLIPAGVVSGAAIAVLALLVWVSERLPNSPYRNWWQ